jgi:hypothetical protein
MVDLQKASLSTNGQQVTLTMPISKVDVEKRIVSGFATLDNIDRQGDRVSADASQKAFENFRGNVRLMHQPIPAGKVVNFRTETFFDQATNKQYSGVFVDTYISKGASDIWEMVLDGTLTGFSIGGAVKDSDNVYDPELEHTVRIIKDYDLVELSLVDSPANQLANIFSIQKTNTVAEGIFEKSHIDNVFWCETDGVAFTGESESKECALCNKNLDSIGWVETMEGEDISKAISKALDSHFKKSDNVLTNEDTPNKYPKQNMPDHSLDECKDPENCPDHMNKKKDENERKGKKKNEMYKASFSVGDFVQWGSSGGTARGKVTRVVTNGKINVPNSSVTVTGTPEDPAVVITVYRKEGNSWKPTETKVGHKMKTLRAWNAKVKKFFGIPTKELLSEETVDKAIGTDSQIESVATKNNEGGVIVAENEEVTTEEVVEVDEVVEGAEDVVETEEAPAIEEAVTEEAPVEEASAEESVEKSDEVASDASTENNGEVVDLVKALDEIKDFISATVSEGTAKSAESVNAVAKTVADVTSSFATKQEELSKTLAEVQETISQIINRVDAVESDTAVKKSGELENAPENNSTLKKSMWGGRFLGSAEYIN